MADSPLLATLRSMSATPHFSPFQRFERIAAAPIAALMLAVCGYASAQQSDSPPELRFDILEYEIDGNSVLPVTAIEQAVTPFLGPGKQMNDVESARAALEKIYQEAGYLTVFVDVPEQAVESGVVRLHVTEGRIERLSVTGSRYFSQGYIRSKLPEFAENGVPNFNTAQQQLAIVNRTEERRVQPVLRPGKQPGTVEVELKVNDSLPLGGTVELNNDHAIDTTPLRLSASLRYDNLFQRDHSLALNAIVAPEKPSESKALVANYSIPLDSGNTVVLYGVASDSNVETLGSTSVLGKGTTLGLRYVLPLAAPGGGYHSLSLGLDYKNLKQKVQQGGIDAVDTPLRYLPMQVAYNGTWGEGGAQTQLAATFTGALRGVFRRQVDNCPRADGTIGPDDQFNCSRRGADGGFATFRIDGRHTEPLPVWSGSALSLRLAGQWATQPLVSAEQFALGGSETVRGYLEGIVTGDNAVLASLELHSPNLWPMFMPAADAGAPAGTPAELMASSFVDAGRAGLIDPLEGQDGHVFMLGAGVGLRLNYGRSVNAALDLAWPQRAVPRQDGSDLRVHARVGLRF